MAANTVLGCAPPHTMPAPDGQAKTGAAEAEGGSGRGRGEAEVEVEMEHEVG
jgi:hypothetical protein